MDHIVADDGNTWITLLETSSGATYRYRVSRRTLCKSSPVFSAMLRGPWTESRPDEHGQYQVKTSRFDPEALLFVLDRLHKWEPAEPSVDAEYDENPPANLWYEVVGWDVRFDYGRFDMFSRIVDIIDYYQMFEARGVHAGVREWVFHGDAFEYTPDNLAMMLRLAHRMKSVDTLRDVVRLCIKKLTGPLDRELPAAIAHLGKFQPLSLSFSLQGNLRVSLTMSVCSL